MHIVSKLIPTLFALFVVALMPAFAHAATMTFRPITIVIPRFSREYTAPTPSPTPTPAPTPAPTPTPTPLPSPTPTPQDPSPGQNGLSATYYDNINLTGTTVSRIDPTIDFDWGGGSPDSAIDSNTFSVRWMGKIEPQFSEIYTFYTRTDDGVRLWVNNQLIIDNWKNQSVTEKSGTITLLAGNKYDIKMEYYDNKGRAVSQLRFSSASASKQIIPSSLLFPN